jgi:hypothetical protein
VTILLDPWSLTWNGDLLDERKAEAYVERLTALFEISKKSVVSLVISDESIELLAADGAYPLAESLPAPLWPNRSDVYKLVTNLLEKLPRLAQLGVIAILIDDSSCEPPFCFATSERHAEHLASLASIALVAEERSLGFAPPILSSHTDAASTHEYSVTVEDVECPGPPLARIGTYAGLIRTRSSPSQCVDDWSPVDLLERGFVEEAIALAIWKANGSCGSDPFEVTNWSLGVNFTRTIGECAVGTNRARAEALLRACSNVVRKVNLRSTHPLRINGAGASPQVTRDHDSGTAWRMDVDHEYHLHYWVVSGLVEFANVVVHNDFRISE